MESEYEAVIEQIVQTIFSTMFEEEMLRMDVPATTEAESLLAAVQIAGQWMGSVVLALSPELANNLSVAMLKVTKEEVTDEDRQDVAAELANMVGGNLKSVLPGPSFLSLPTIIAGRQFGVQMHDAELVESVALSSPFGSLRVRLYAKLPELATLNS